jgi:hypothetical protein
MELTLIIGISFLVVALSGWIVGVILLHRHAQRTSDAPLASSDREAALQAQSLYNQAVAGQMASMASAQRQ